MNRHHIHLDLEEVDCGLRILVLLCRDSRVSKNRQTVCPIAMEVFQLGQEVVQKLVSGEVPDEVLISLFISKVWSAAAVHKQHTYSDHRVVSWDWC